MFERTITVGSAGKMLGVTGWRVGWAMGPKEIIRAIWMVHMNIPFSVATPLQEATALAIKEAQNNGFFTDCTKLYEQQRDKLMKILDETGLKPTLPHGGYFILADTSKIPDSNEPNEKRRDFRICRKLTSEIGVTAIPPSAFYSEADQEGRSKTAGNLARFAFCKNDEQLAATKEKLSKWRS